ncbi:MAG: LamG-like jellyroll fold domain-containing protein [Vicinamibacterales bacterium]
MTLRVYDNDRSDNVIYTNLDGTTASIDPRFNPATVTTVGISAQGVDVLDPPGATEPPAVTTTGTNLFYLQQPSNVAPGAVMAPPVQVRIWDNTGAPLPGVIVSIALDSPPAGVLLSGTTSAVADGDGIATFTALSVNLPATGLRLRATATSPGAVAAGTSAPFDVSVAGGPVSLWHADGTALDSVGGNHGTLQGGASYGPGRIGPAFSFSNPLPAGTADQYVLVPDDPSLRITNQMTMSAWIYPTGPGTGPAPFGVGEGGVIVNKEYAYEMARFADGSIRWAFGNGVDSFAPLPYWVNSGGTAPLNAWTHVAVTYNSGTVTTYINGTSVGSITPPSMVFGAGTRALRIGGREYAPGAANFDGRIDEVGIQDRALSAAEVLALYSGALPATPVAVSIGNTSAVFDGAAKPVTVTTTPPGVPVTVIYGTGLAAPSAIGAYGVQAIVSENGYQGAAGATMTIASTIAAGGPGGGPYPASGALSCSPGVFANGVRAATGSGIDYALTSGQLLCSDAVHPVKFGGGTTPNADLACPSGQVMVGLSGMLAYPFGAQPVVGGISPRCQLPSGGPITDGPGPLPVALGTPFGPIDCPAGQAVTGVVGGQGAVVDSIALVCGPVTAAQFTETVITGDASILNDGVLIAANDLGASPNAVTINGVVFGTDQGGLAGSWGPGGGDFSIDASFSANLDAVLSDLQFSGTLTPVTFTIGGLTPGATYRLQLLFSNDLNTTGDRVEVTVAGATWILDDWRPDAINLTVQFTATSSSVVTTFAPGAGSTGESGRAVLNGYVVHQMSP